MLEHSEPQRDGTEIGREDEPAQRSDAPSSTAPAEGAAASLPGDSLPHREMDRTVVGTVLEVEREFIWIETEGTRAKLYASELMLDIGEVPADRYEPGDRFAAFVFQMELDPESGAPQFSVRRAVPYPRVLSSLEVGSVVAKATVVNTYDVGIELDIDGVRGNAFFNDLPLASDESTHDRYQPGDTVHDLTVYRVNHGAHELYLSDRRNAPGYVEALDAHSVGDVVSGVVTYIEEDGSLWLDVDGVIGSVAPDELALADGESAQDRYSVGETVDDLFLWQVDRDDRGLGLSVKRNAPSYVEALAMISPGNTPDGIVKEANEWGLWLDVTGVVGWISADELQLDEGQSPRSQYSVGDSVKARVWQIDLESRDIALSVRRLSPDFSEEPIAVGGAIDGAVRDSRPGGIEVLVASRIVRVPHCELSLGIGDRLRFEPKQSIRVVVLAMDTDGNPTALSHRRTLPGWQAAVGRLAPGSIVENAIVLPLKRRAGW